MGLPRSAAAPLRQYALAVAAAAFAFVLAAAGVRTIEDAPVLAFLGATVAAAAYGGLAPALLVALAGVVAIDHLEAHGVWSVLGDQGVVLESAAFAGTALVAGGLQAARRAAHARDRAALDAAHTERLVAAERERIALELHDGALQALYGTVLSLGAAARTAGADPDRTSSDLAAAVAQVNGAIRELRACVSDLRPGVTTLAELRAGLEVVAAGARAAGVPSVAVELAPDGAPLPGLTGTHLLRIAQEAVSNALRHAFPTTLSLQLAVEDDRLVLQVSDDGRGFDAAVVGGRGYGLSAMARRAELMGGQLSVTSAAGRGTVVRVEAPMDTAY